MEEKKTQIPSDTPESIAAPDDAAKRSRRRWRRFLVLYAVVWLLFASLGCAAFYKYLRVYEQALPEHVMDSLMETTAPETWLGYVKASIESESGEFDDAAALYEEYESVLLAGKSFSYRRAPESRADAPKFIVRCGGVDEAVYINGIPLTDAQIAETGLALPDMPVIESRFTAAPALTRYRVEKMYGSITVTDASGAEIAPEADAGDGVTRYALPLPRYSVSITAPSDVTVTLCGAVLTLDDAESSDRGILRGLENYTGDQAFDTVRWSFDGLYSLPDVQATAADGTALSPLVGKNGQLMFFHPNNASLQSAVEDRVRYFFNRYIDYSSRSFQGNLALTREDVENDEIEMNPATRASMRRYYGLLDCIMWTTDLYRYIQESTDAMIWASATSVSYDELTFTDFSFVGANCFVCTVRYKADFTANSWQEQKNYNMQNAYELAFVCPNGGAWYAAAMDAVTE